MLRSCVFLFYFSWLHLFWTLASASSCESSGGWFNCTLRVEVVTVRLPFKNISFRARTYNGTFPGPPLRVSAGDKVRILLQNRLGDNLDKSGCSAPLSHFRAANSTNLHIHGIYADAAQDNTFVCVDPGSERLYSYTVRPDAGTQTLFYHPHLDGSSSMQLYGGMAGAFEIVDAKKDRAFGMRSSGRTLVLQMLDFNPSSKNYIETVLDMQGISDLPVGLHNPEKYTGLLLLVNGEANASSSMHIGQYARFNLINAFSGSAFSLNIGFLGDSQHVCHLHVLAYDGVYLRRPRLQASVFLPAGGRADVSVTCDEAGTHHLGTTVRGSEGFGGVFPPQYLMLSLDVQGRAAESVFDTLPRVLPGPPPFYPDLTQANECATHTIMLSTESGANEVNGWPYNGSISHRAETGHVQEWHLIGGQGNGLEKQHPYHQHMTHFQIVATSLNTSGLFDVGDYRDTVPLYRALNFTVRFLPAFEGAMMVHCHVLKHEDLGMMTLVNFTASQAHSFDPFYQYPFISWKFLVSALAVAILATGAVVVRSCSLCKLRCRCSSDYLPMQH
eukprot:TRINITY_DN72406_c0_g1_i1.p1 TRINITY_DN72406_c0_g1~~TRINITY_DN72406_c0_g1_i1.p1  ORF type:complete len:577 (+),score=24.66 TRINITY_DN72406_c0_g1_i1:62-1732(+)